MITRSTSLSGNIVGFCRYLRQHNFSLSVEEEATALDALQLIDPANRRVFKLALKTALCRSLNELSEFDELFDDYWTELGRAVDSKIKNKTEPVLNQGKADASFKALKSWLNGNRNEKIEQMASYSFNQSLSLKDFSAVQPDELEEMVQSIKALSRRLAARLNRRYEKSAKINLPDLRRTLRKNMRHGGELIEIAFRKPKRNRTKVVVLCDVSKSMDLYASFLLKFMYAFQQVYSRVETFAFSTSLQHITARLKQNNFHTALKFLGSEGDSWSGGTRIGESLHSFVREYAFRILDKRTIVIILSDGWDTGNVNLLEGSMELIHKRCKKIIWLNPLAGHASYSPSVAGMQAAMPYIDVFASIHNLDSLRQLSKWL